MGNLSGRDPSVIVVVEAISWQTMGTGILVGIVVIQCLKLRKSNPLSQDARVIEQMLRF